MKHKLIIFFIVFAVIFSAFPAVLPARGDDDGSGDLTILKVGFPNNDWKINTTEWSITEFRLYFSKPLNLPLGDGEIDRSNNIYNLIRINGKTLKEWLNLNTNNILMKYWNGEQLLTIALPHSGTLGQHPQTTDLLLYVDPGLSAIDGNAMTKGQGFLYKANQPNVGYWPSVPYAAPGAGDASVPFMVTEVGVRDGNIKVTDLFGWGILYYKIYLSKPLQLPGASTDNDGVIIDEAINSRVRINGKSIHEWRTSHPGSVQLKYDPGAHCIEVAAFFNQGLCGSLTEDLLMYIDPGLTAADGTVMTAGQGYLYVGNQVNAGEWPSVPYGATGGGDTSVPFMVTEVGVPDGNVRVTDLFGWGIFYYKIYLSKPLQISPSAIDQDGVIIDEAINSLIRINGRSIHEWRANQKGVQLKYVASGQFFEVAAFFGQGLCGSLTEDWLMYIEPGLMAADGTVMTAGQGFQHTGKHRNSGNWPPIQYTAAAPGGPLEVLLVGVPNENKKVADFSLVPGVALYFQIYFTKPLDLPQGVLADDMNDLFKINGKSVTEWRQINENSIRLEYDTALNVITAFMNYNCGISTNPQSADILLHIAPGLTATDGSRISSGLAFKYLATGDNTGTWPAVPYNTTPDQGALTVSRVGVPSENAKVADFSLIPNVALYYQIYFSKLLTLPDGNLSDEFNDLFIINGKTVTEWRRMNSASVRLEYNSGMNGITVFMNYGQGVGFNPPRNIRMYIAPGLTAIDGDVMREGKGFHFIASEGNVGDWPEIEYSEAPVVDLTITDVGVPELNMKVVDLFDWGVSLYYKIYFSKPLNLNDGVIEDESVTDLFWLNGRTVTDWREDDPDSVRLEYRALLNVIEVYMGFGHGLGYNPPQDIIMYIDPGLTAADGESCTEGAGFEFIADKGNTGNWDAIDYEIMEPAVRKGYINFYCQLVDSEKNPITDAMIKLDGQNTTFSDRNGLFFFGGVITGDEPHTIVVSLEGKALGSYTFKVQYSDILPMVSVYGSSITIPVDESEIQVSFMYNGEGAFRLINGYLADIIDYTEYEYEDIDDETENRNNSRENGDNISENDDIGQPNTGDSAKLILNAALLALSLFAIIISNKHTSKIIKKHSEKL